MTPEQQAIGRRQLELERALLAQGMDPGLAAMAAARGVMATARAERGLRADRAAAEYEDAMGMPIVAGNAAALDSLEGAAAPIEMEREFGATSTPKPVAYRVPGPRDTTGYAEPGAPIYDEEAAAEYSARPSMQDFSEEQIEAELASGGPYAGGGYMPSQKDRDMYSRGMVPTYDPATGEVGYTVAYPQPAEFGDGIPTGGPGRLGLRPDLRKPVVDARTGNEIPGTAKYDKATMPGPLGDVETYAPSPAFRAQLDAHEDRQRVGRLADRAGYGPNERAALVASKEPVDLVALRAQGDAVRASDKAARQEAVVRRRMAQTNPLEYMNRDDISDWNRMVAADALLRRGYRGATPLDVEGAHNKQLTELGLRVAQGQGFQQLTPEQRQVMQLRAEEAQRGLPAEERAPQFRDQPTVHPSEVQMVDDYVKTRFSAPGTFGLSSSFTAADQEQTFNWLVNEKGYKPEKARQLVGNIVTLREGQSMFGNWGD